MNHLKLKLLRKQIVTKSIKFFIEKYQHVYYRQKIVRYYFLIKQ